MKTCKACNYNVFGGGYCKNHQYLRTDKKPKPVRKISKKQHKRLGNRKQLSEQDRLFFLEIWDERPHLDFEINEPIPGECLNLYFHHVLEKGLARYSQFRYEKWNIVLLNWQHHDQVDKNLDKLPKVKSYRQYLLNNLLKIKNGTLIPSVEGWLESL